MSSDTDPHESSDFYYVKLYHLLESFISVQKMRQTVGYKRIKTEILNCVEYLLGIIDQVNNISADYANSLLHLAAKTESTEILEMLLLRGADVNAQNHDLETPLHLALENNETSVVQLLLRNGADPKIVNKDNYSSFHFLIKFCGESMINIFLQSEIPFDFHLSSGKEFLEFAVANNSVKMLQLAFDHSDKLKEEDINSSKLLHGAVKNNNVDIVKLLLKKGFNINATLPSDLGATPLQIAVKQKYEDIIPFLLDNNADVNSKDNSGMSILHHVVAYDYQDFIKIDVDNNGSVVCNIADNYHDASIIIDTGFTKILKLLLDRGADVNIKDSEGFTPLHRSVKKGNKEFVSLLVEKGSDVNASTTDTGSTPLHLLANTLGLDHGEETDYMSKCLLENGANLKARDQYDFTPLDNAIESENLQIVCDILDKNPDPNDKRNKLSFCLSFIEFHEDDENDEYFLDPSKIQKKNGRTTAEVFVEHGFTICHEDFKAVYIPAGFQHLVKDKFNSTEFRTMVFNLLNKNEVTNSKKIVKLCMEYLILFGSIKRGFSTIVDNLLTPAVNVNVLLHTRRTLLHIASKFGHFSFVEELLKRGADVNAVDFDKMSALHFSVLRDHANIAELLLKNQAIMEARNSQNQTSLFVAVQEKSYECIKLLLNLGANINFVDEDRKSPLHAAVDNNDILSVKILLHYGAIYNNENFRPLFDTEAYISNLSIEMTEMLFDHGAKMIGLDKFLKPEKCSKFIIKSIAGNVDNLDFPEDSTTEDSTTEDFRIKCQEEIEKMKLMRINGFNISIYEMLTNEEKKIAFYMRNENIVEVLNILDFEHLFPIFSSKLRTRLMKGEIFSRLVELAYHCLDVILNFSLPAVIRSEIFSYLEERDLRCLVFASPIDSEIKASIRYKD